MNDPRTDEQDDCAINLESWCFDELDRGITSREEPEPCPESAADFPQPDQRPRCEPPPRELRPDCFPSDLV